MSHCNVTSGLVVENTVYLVNFRNNILIGRWNCKNAYDKKTALQQITKNEKKTFFFLFRLFAYRGMYVYMIT